MTTIKTLPVGELEANCFVVSDAQKQCILIDPGAEPNNIRRYIEENELHPLAILLTHAHFDHFGAAPEMMQYFEIPLYVHPLDEPLLHSAKLSVAETLGFGDQYQNIGTEIRHFEEGDVLRFSDELVFIVLHTPGHTPGGCCFLFEEDKMFSGDTLFHNGVGRVDFPGGNIRDMRASLARLGKLPGDRTVYCGHYENTTLDHEREFGGYLIPRKRW